MKLRAKLVIFILAAVISFAGFGLIANGLNFDHLLQAAQPQVQTTFTLTQILG
jgi:hypothetical protein